ncbi:hypothetical protein B0T14DRAFT_247243 [Immersiella caudata]|uniref:Uncharacterized protein n=1 Tax=Immersiella caudata TaxID=314043 RepID=A0AA39WJB0_9PEZI|nr:hypothetical protein B0T14DRAFT_247243 [Immersiella caudata]
MDSPQNQQSTSEGFVEGWDSGLSNGQTSLPFQNYHSEGPFPRGQDFVFPALPLPSYTMSSDSSCGTYYGSSDGRSNTCNADVSASSYSSYEIPHWESTYPSHVLPPDCWTYEPIEFEPTEGSTSHWAGSHSPPDFSFRPHALELPLQPHLNDELGWHRPTQLSVGSTSAFSPPSFVDPSVTRQANHPLAPGKSKTTISREAKGRQHQCPHCDFCPKGQRPAHLLRVHVLRQHESLPIECDEEGCSVVIANGRKDNLRKHQGTENCAGFRRRKAAEATEANLQRWLNELAGQPCPPALLTLSAGCLSFPAIPPVPMNGPLVQDFQESCRQIDASRVHEGASGEAGFYHSF